MTKSRTLRVTWGLLAVSAGVALAWSPVPSAATRGQSDAAAVTTLDVSVTDKDGRPVESVAPADLTVTLDGKPRAVRWVRRVSRGPGAVSDAATRLAKGDATLRFAADPVRNVVLVVDQATLARGDERRAVQAGGALLDRMGLSDLIAVLRLPFTPDQQAAFTTERPILRTLLARTAGLLTRGSVAKSADIASAPQRNGGGEPIADDDPNRAPEAVVPSIGRAGGPPPADGGRARSNLAGLSGLVKALRATPGRKAVVIASAGLLGADAERVAEAGAAAVAARVTLYALELPAFRDDSGAPPDQKLLGELARATGGFSTSVGRNPERATDRIVADLGACFTLGIESESTAEDDRPAAVRVSAARRDLTVRASAWLPAGPAPVDTVPAPASSDAAKSAAVTQPKPATPKDARLDAMLARVFDYVDAYERSYSALVAEEEYKQTSGARILRLKSDVLLVKTDSDEVWVSFRDVFEADGKQVRDRDDRLKRLFLEPGVLADAQMRRIKDESARYNIGPVTRNINVPLFALKFLSARYRAGFRFTLGGRGESSGLRTIRLEYKEVGRPTVISSHGVIDVPCSGFFVVEEVTGAVVESQMSVEDRAYLAGINVKFRLDRGIGLWVPSEMQERYQTRSRAASGSLEYDRTMMGQAAYTKFRRFQVQTEEKVIIPK
jgi:VWFA-related protein